MTRTAKAPKGADYKVSYIFPKGTVLTGYTGTFTVYVEPNGTTLLTVTNTPNPNGSFLSFDANILSVDIKNADIIALPADAMDTENPSLLFFNLTTLTAASDLVKVDGGPFLVLPYGAPPAYNTGDVIVTLDGLDITVEVAATGFDTAVLTVVTDAAAAAALSAYNAAAEADAAQVSAGAAATDLAEIEALLIDAAAGPFVSYMATQSLSASQKTQARTNIDADGIYNITTAAYLTPSAAISAWATSSSTSVGAQFAPSTAKSLYFAGGVTNTNLETVGSGNDIRGDGNASAVTGTVKITDFHSSVKNMQIRDGRLELTSKAGFTNRYCNILNVDLYNSAFLMGGLSQVNSLVNLIVFKPPLGAPGLLIDQLGCDMHMTNANIYAPAGYDHYGVEYVNGGQLKVVNSSFDGFKISGRTYKPVVESYYKNLTAVSAITKDFAISSVADNGSGGARFFLAGTVNVSSWADAGNRVTDGSATEYARFDFTINGGSTVSSTMTQLTVGGVDILNGSVTFTTRTQAVADTVTRINAYTGTSGWVAVADGTTIRVTKNVLGTTWNWQAISLVQSGGFAIGTINNFIECTTAANHPYVQSDDIEVKGTANGTPISITDVANAYDYVHEVRWSNGTNKLGFVSAAFTTGALGYICQVPRLVPGLTSFSVSGGSNAAYNQSLYVSACGSDWFDAVTTGGVTIAYSGTTTGATLRRPWFDLVFTARDNNYAVNDQWFDGNTNFLLIASGYNMEFSMRIKSQIWIDKRTPALHANRITFKQSRRGRQQNAFNDIPIGGTSVGFMIAPSASDNTGASTAGAMISASQFPIYGPSLTNNMPTYSGIIQRPNGQIALSVNGSEVVWDGTALSVPAFATGTGTAANPAYAVNTNNGMYWDGSALAWSFNSDKVMKLSATTLTVSPTSGGAGLVVSATGAGASSRLQGDTSTVADNELYINGSGDGQIRNRKARGTIAVPAAVQINDLIGRYTWDAYTGSGFTTAASIRTQVVETGTVSAAAIGTKMILSVTPIGSGALTEVANLTVANGLQMYGANTVIDANRFFVGRGFTVAQLNALTGVPTYAKGFASDALAPAFGATVVGAGAVKTPVWFDGSAWKVG